MRLTTIAAVLLLLVLVSLPARSTPAEREIAVVNLGWHTGIALRVADIDLSVIPEARHFAAYPWIVIGWGDAEFYRNPDPDISVYLSAAFTGTPAVLQLVGLHSPPESYFSRSEVVPVALSEAEHRDLQTYIGRHFTRSGARRAEPVGEGLYPASLFFPAEGTFSLVHTCNTWVAQGLAAAGLEIAADEIIRASAVMTALRAALEKRRAAGQAPGNSDLPGVGVRR